LGSLRQRRIALAIIFSTLGLSSLFLAQGTTRLVAASVFDLDASGVAQAQAAASRSKSNLGAGSGSGPQDKDPTAILRRNIFDSETGSLLGSEKDETKTEKEPEPTDEPVDPNAPLPTCEGSIRLVGTVVSDYRGEWSFAAVIGASGKAKLYRTGMTLDGKELIAVQLNRVLFEPEQGRLCQVQMFSDGKKNKKRVAVRRKNDNKERKRHKAKRQGSISQSELEQGIEQVSSTKYNVDRKLVDKVLQNQAELMRSARIIPHEEGGRVTGVKLYGIRRNSLLGKLGLNNGDKLRTINGFDMTSPDKALEAYAKLRNADHLTVAVERRGKPMNLDYNIK
jgi:general secretion pathway protein C